MLKGLEVFKNYFEKYNDQYVLIGGAALDILFENNNTPFRATRDLDVVLIIEAITPEFGIEFWKFIESGKYRNKSIGNDKNQFYRFDKPKDESFPKMIELFCRKGFELTNMTGITPIHIDDTVSSLSAILLNDDYYEILIAGKKVIKDISVLGPEYLLLFKIKAHLDLRERRNRGEMVDLNDVKKHKTDILRIISEFTLNKINYLPKTVKNDVEAFADLLKKEPYDFSQLKRYGLNNANIIDALINLYM